MRACSARQPDIVAKSFFCATYHANNSLKCARIAIVCRMREACEKSRVGRNNCELMASKTTSQSREISQSMRSGMTRRAGRYNDPGDHRYSSRVVGAVETPRRISEPGIGPYLLRVRRNYPHRLVSLYHPPTRVGGRSRARTNQRF